MGVMTASHAAIPVADRPGPGCRTRLPAVIRRLPDGWSR